MALINCAECGKEISSKAIACPYCGCPIDKDIINCEIIQDNMEGTDEKADIEKESEEKQSDSLSNGKKHNKGLLLGVILAIIVIISVVIFTDSRKCTFSNCSNPKIANTNYCDEHTCQADGCSYSKVKYEKYCFIHQCSVDDCGELKTDDSDYCDAHKCHELGCKKLGTTGGYCSEHAIDMNKKLKKKLLLLFNYKSTGGVNLVFCAENLTDKEIKYIDFMAHLSNSVGDKVCDEITGKTYIPVEIVGPIKPGEYFEFRDTIGYSDTCSRISIYEITITYMDGTVETGKFGYAVETGRK